MTWSTDSTFSVAPLYSRHVQAESPHDPRNPEIEAFICGQDEETEFCLRQALNGLSPHVRGDRRYQARFRELQDKLVKTEDDVVRRTMPHFH
jgi:hypothetical protein